MKNHSKNLLTDDRLSILQINGICFQVYKNSRCIDKLPLSVKLFNFE